MSSSQPNNQNVVPPPAPQESIVTKIIGGFMWWIRSLTGKPQPKKQSAPAAPATAPIAGSPAPVAKPATKSDDSVSQDLAAFKKLVGQVSQKVSANVAPAIEKRAAATGVAVTKLSNSGNKGLIKKILKIFFIILILLLLVFAAIKLFSGKGGGGLGSKATPTLGPATSTPTPIVYEPPAKSVYADDPVILKLEQDINVLTREIAGTNIKETQLNPPSLDFNVSF